MNVLPEGATKYDPKKQIEMAEEKPIVNITIHGGNNQILPVAQHAEQHFHYHSTEKQEESARTCIYTNVYVDAAYIDKLRACCTASDLAQAVVEMVHDKSIPYLDKYLAVKAAFFTKLLPFCPNVRSGITESNLREQINKALRTKSSKPYGQQD